MVTIYSMCVILSNYFKFAIDLCTHCVYNTSIR
nr:MAG TPA: hypothetical protein [Caudoviricetes sp.]